MKKFIFALLLALSALPAVAQAPAWPPQAFYQSQLVAVPVLTASSVLSITAPNVIANCTSGCTLQLVPCFPGQRLVVFNSTTYNGSTNGIAIFTGTAGSGADANQLTVTAVSGEIFVGSTVAGPGIPFATVIVSQASGTAGGAGVYVTSNPTTANAASLISGAVTVNPQGSDQLLSGYSGPVPVWLTGTETQFLAVGQPGGSPSCSWAIAN